MKTMAGLYIRKSLSYKLEKYAKRDDMKRMLEIFKQNIAIDVISAEEYEELERVAFEDED